MDSRRFDAFTRALTQSQPRRYALALLGGALGTSRLAPRSMIAKKKKKKKTTLCLDGQTIQASKKKRKKLLKSGATAGECPSSPPPPPPGCTPNCAGKPCGVDDGCGALCGCAAGSLCHGGVCRACTVTCDGNGPACGDILQDALEVGGTVFACPGRYVGNFAMNAAVTLIGAGQGPNPASNTVLDANSNGRPVFLGEGISATLEQVHITGGNVPSSAAPTNGGGVLNLGLLTMTACTIHQNSAAGSGGGIQQGASGPLTLNSCTISNNTAGSEDPDECGGGGLNHANATHTVFLNGCTVSGNRSFGNGGGIRLSESGITITGSVISGNRAEDRGGGIYNGDGAATLDAGSRITGNTAGDVGGGILNSGVVTLGGADVSGNQPDQCFGFEVAGCENAV